MADLRRINELRRRIQQDPASIVFAQLAEEHRRSGDHNEAVRLCRAGLAHHPSYLSARVTLGRALMALGQDEAARAEFEQVLQAASDNVLALRSLEELDGRRASQPAAPAPADGAHLEELERWLGAIQSDRVQRERLVRESG